MKKFLILLVIVGFLMGCDSCRKDTPVSPLSDPSLYDAYSVVVFTNIKAVNYSSGDARFVTINNTNISQGRAVSIYEQTNTPRISVYNPKTCYSGFLKMSDPVSNYLNQDLYFVISWVEWK
jgi:hypothetical protein